MEELAKQQKGYLDIEFARNEIGITVLYWQTLEDIVAWKNNIEHKRGYKYGKKMV